MSERGMKEEGLVLLTILLGGAKGSSKPAWRGYVSCVPNEGEYVTVEKYLYRVRYKQWFFYKSKKKPQRECWLTVYTKDAVPAQ